VLVHPARYKVVACGRQWGKTVLGAVACLVEALKGGEVWWVGPTFPVAIHGWRKVLELAGQIPGVKIEGRPMPSVILPGGGRIEMKSSNDPHSLRGATLSGVVFDEAAFAQPEAWQYLQPTLAIRQGWAIFISTPSGTNWFFDLYESAGSLGEWMRWRLPSTSSPWFPPSEIERAKQTMTSQKLAQEYGAEFISGVTMFRSDWIQHYYRRDDALVLGEEIVPLGQMQRMHTVDLAWSQEEGADFTVISTWGITRKRHLCLLEAQRARLEGPDIVPRLRLAYERWGGEILVEKATRQLGVIQDAVRSGLPVRAISSHKGGLRGEDAKIARAAVAMARMEQRTVWFPPVTEPWWADLEEELLAFPDGKHDDFVDTLSYAAAEVAEGGGYDERGIPWL
jgi:predicted phage terminase large subunit-like protein